MVQHSSRATEERSVSNKTGSYSTPCIMPYARLFQGLTPCPNSVVYSRGITVDDHLPLESPAVDQLQVLLTPPAIIHK